MAWFHKSLEDMKEAIEREDWVEVKKILQQHNKSLDKESPEIEHDLLDASHRISQYGEDIIQLSHMLKAEMKGTNLKNEMLAKVNSAINQAHFFEKTMMHLIKERKFME